MWYLTAGLITFLMVMELGWRAWKHKYPPTAEQLALQKQQESLSRWGRLVSDAAWNYRYNDQKQFNAAGGCSNANAAGGCSNAMEMALTKRKVIVGLLQAGHAHAAKNVLAEVDQIIETIEVTFRARAVYGYGKWEARPNPWVYEWVPNPNREYDKLANDCGMMLYRLDLIIEHIRSIAREGVSASTESVKLHLQVHRQDCTASKEADIATAKELEDRPL